MQPKRIAIRLLAGSLNDYRKATQIWWSYVERSLPSIVDRPVYFVSSNAHSIVNLVSGFALRHQDELLEYIQSPECADLLSEWQDIEARQVPSSRENFLYYAVKKYVRTEMGQKARQARSDAEREAGVMRVPSVDAFDVEVQLFELNKIRPEWLDSRLGGEESEALSKSDAVIVNIDYPLGMAAYIILAHQYIAAELNQLNDASIPLMILESWEDAGELLVEYESALDIPKKTSDRNEAINLSEMLDAYNNGTIGPGHCSD